MYVCICIYTHTNVTWSVPELGEVLVSDLETSVVSCRTRRKGFSEKSMKAPGSTGDLLIGKGFSVEGLGFFKFRVQSSRLVCQNKFNWS